MPSWPATVKEASVKIDEDAAKVTDECGQLVLTPNITMEYLEHAVVWVPQKPIDFVHEYLTTEVNFDPLTATWLFLQNEFERTELVNELAMAIAYLLEAWPQIKGFVAPL